LEKISITTKIYRYFTHKQSYNYIKGLQKFPKVIIRHTIEQYDCLWTRWLNVKKQICGGRCIERNVWNLRKRLSVKSRKLAFPW
jgi:hypothetical protein